MCISSCLRRFATFTIVYLHNANNLSTQIAFTITKQSFELPQKNQNSCVTIIIQILTHIWSFKKRFIQPRILLTEWKVLPKTLIDKSIESFILKLLSALYKSFNKVNSHLLLTLVVTTNIYSHTTFFFKNFWFLGPVFFIYFYTRKVNSRQYIEKKSYFKGFF